jgi:hypothetical protein
LAAHQEDESKPAKSVLSNRIQEVEVSISAGKIICFTKNPARLIDLFTGNAKGTNVHESGKAKSAGGRR